MKFIKIDWKKRCHGNIIHLISRRNTRCIRNCVVGDVYDYSKISWKNDNNWWKYKGKTNFYVFFRLFGDAIFYMLLSTSKTTRNHQKTICCNLFQVFLYIDSTTTHIWRVLLDMENAKIFLMKATSLGHTNVAANHSVNKSSKIQNWKKFTDKDFSQKGGRRSHNPTPWQSVQVGNSVRTITTM
jgi:hypothetical protein